MKIISRLATDFLPNTEIWHVYSDHVDDVLRICISGPDSPKKTDHRVGAVYAMDAPWLAGSLANVISGCNLSGELPPLYAISLGYPLDRSPSHLFQRTRDLTPTACPDLDLVLPLMLESTQVVASGAADAFLDFLVSELRPALEVEFEIDSAETAIAGASLGGLFTLHALLSRPEQFQRYLAISPSIWWDDRLLLRRAQSMTESHSAPRGKVYMCVGAMEGPEVLKSRLASLPQEVRSKIPACFSCADIREDMYKMSKTLSAWNGSHFRVAAHVYAEESHNSIGGAALSRGLRTLYGSLAW